LLLDVLEQAMAPSYNSRSSTTNEDDNDTVATGATFLIITKPDGSRSCLKHPEMRLEDGSCPTCDLEFSQYQEMLRKKKESLNMHLHKIEEQRGKAKTDTSSFDQNNAVSSYGYNANFADNTGEGKDKGTGTGTRGSEDFLYANQTNFPLSSSGISTSMQYPMTSTLSNTMPPFSMMQHSPTVHMPQMQMDPTNNQMQQYPVDAFTMQMQRMQQMQDWMLMQKEQEVQILRKKVEEQQQALHEQAIEFALLQEKSQQQKKRIDQEMQYARAMVNSKDSIQGNHEQELDKELESDQGKWGTNNQIKNREKYSQRQQKQESLKGSSETKKENLKISSHSSRSKTIGTKSLFSSQHSNFTSPDSESQFRNTRQLLPTTNKAPPPSATRPVISGNNHKNAHVMNPVTEEVLSAEVDSFGFQMIGYDIDVDDSASNAGLSVEGLTLCTGFMPTRETGQGLTRESSQSLTVATSTYGEDRIQVVEKSVLDPYGDKGTFTGFILKSTTMPHGTGKMVYDEDQRTYDGEWRHGRWHGFGHAFFANGDSYEGNYRFDQRHGKGTYCWNDGRMYNGMFSEDMRHGKGIFKWPDGSVYEGEFNNGQREGHGSYTFSTGGQYEGEWKDGRYNGFGACSWEDGRFYQGDWKNGTAHGKGVETYSDGTIRHDGNWINDEPVRD